MINLAQEELLDNCATLLRMMHMGFRTAATRFLGTLTPDGARSLYAGVFEEEEEINTHECAIVNYQSSYIREMDVPLLHKFLVW